MPKPQRDKSLKKKRLLSYNSAYPPEDKKYASLP